MQLIEKCDMIWKESDAAAISLQHKSIAIFSVIISESETYI